MTEKKRCHTLCVFLLKATLCGGGKGLEGLFSFSIKEDYGCYNLISANGGGKRCSCQRQNLNCKGVMVPITLRWSEVIDGMVCWEGSSTYDTFQMSKPIAIERDEGSRLWRYLNRIRCSTDEHWFVFLLLVGIYWSRHPQFWAIVCLRGIMTLLSCKSKFRVRFFWRLLLPPSVVNLPHAVDVFSWPIIFANLMAIEGHQNFPPWSIRST